MKAILLTIAAIALSIPAPASADTAAAVTVGQVKEASNPDNTEFVRFFEGYLLGARDMWARQRVLGDYEWVTGLGLDEADQIKMLQATSDLVQLCVQRYQHDILSVILHAPEDEDDTALLDYLNTVLDACHAGSMNELR